jgi:hypothetical protein
MAIDINYQIPAYPGVITGGRGNDILAGTAGLDFAQLDAGRRASQVVDGSQGPVTVTSAAGVDQIQSIETLLFVDGREVYNAEDAAAQVTRLYNVALGRDADQAGLNAFVQVLDNGGALSDVARALIDSGEFATSFGVNQSSTVFVNSLYQNLRGGPASPAEVSGWAVRIDNGDLSRTDVALAFADSAENRAATASTLSAGIWDRDETAIEIANLYDTAFNRLPDLPGLASWVSLVHREELTVKSVAESFYNSAEAAPLQGLTDAAFVNQIYLNALGRQAEATGSAFWVNHINTDMSRAEVLLAISSSAEHQQINAEQFQSENPLSYGVSLVA